MDTHGEGMQLLAAHARRLRAARELRRRADDRAGMRGEPDQFADGRGEPEGGSAAAHVQHPGHRRHRQDHRPRHRSHQGDAAARQRRDAAAGAGVAHHRRPAMRRLGRLLGHHRQSVAGRGGRPAGAPRRHGDPVGDARDLRRRTPADAPRGVARSRRKARLAHQVVGGLHDAREGRDEQQSVAGQQGRRPDDDPRKIARRRGQGRHDQPRRRVRIRGAGDGQGLRLHGHAGLRSGLGDRDRWPAAPT